MESYVNLLATSVAILAIFLPHVLPQVPKYVGLIGILLAVGIAGYSLYKMVTYKETSPCRDALGIYQDGHKVGNVEFAVGGKVDLGGITSPLGELHLEKEWEWGNYILTCDNKTPFPDEVIGNRNTWFKPSCKILRSYISQ